MIAEYRSKSNIGIGIGFVVAVIGGLLVSGGNEGIGWAVLILGFVTFVYGCCMFALAKGQPAFLGLLGVLGLLGLLFLVFMPDKTATPATPPDSSSG